MVETPGERGSDNTIRALDGALYPLPDYRFCPKCGGGLAIKSDGDVRRPICQDCGFVYYVNPSPAVGGVLVESGKVLLVERAIEPYLGDWCLPAGFMEYGERPQDTLAREIAEETALVLEGPPVMLDVKTGTDDPRTHALFIVYWVDGWSGDLKAGDDASDARWFDLRSPPANVAFTAHREVLNEIRSGVYAHVYSGC
ncbi:MAG: NUDIX hydrolase [Candidatus Latescibacteria bacterium]|jgi:ADP-ribose pyrophosphatase YjhB (NUDIX family)|nr:NUDIX hydrolase [Candidatus Latescibacterota bacterium]